MNWKHITTNHVISDYDYRKLSSDKRRNYREVYSEAVTHHSQNNDDDVFMPLSSSFSSDNSSYSSPNFDSGSSSYDNGSSSNDFGGFGGGESGGGGAGGSW